MTSDYGTCLRSTLARKILIDSDVILDLFLSREPHHTYALHFFSHIDVKRASVAAFASPVAIANVGYVLTKLKNQQYAVGKLRELRTLLAVAPMDEKTVDLALARPYRDFEYALQYQCAVGNGMATLVTRNERDYPGGTVQVIAPLDFMRLDLAEVSPMAPL